MTPEQEAREEIDDQLQQTGWAVQNASEMDISGKKRCQRPNLGNMRYITEICYCGRHLFFLPRPSERM